MTTQRRVLVVAIIVSFIAFLDGAVINVALPAIREDLGGGLVVQQWVVDGYLVTLGALILIAGSLSDSFGRLRIMRIGLYGFGISSLVCALAPSGVALVAARVAQGAAGALLVPSALALIMSNFTKEEQGKAIGTWTAWTTAAFLGGPLLGGVLVDLANWRWVFAINVAPIAAALILMRGLEADRPRAAKVDFLGAALGILALGGPVFGLIEQERLGWASPGVYLPILVGGVVFAIFLWWESRVREPMVPLGMFRVRNFGFGNLATLFIYGAFGFGGFLLPVFVQEVGGYPATIAGLVSLPMGVLLILLSRRVGALASKHGARLFMTAGPLVVAAGYLYLLVVNDDVSYWPQIFPGVMLIGFGVALTVAPLTSATLGAVDPARSGIGSAINNAVSRVAGLVTIACTGLIVGRSLDLDGFHRAVVVTAAMLVIGGLVSFAGIRKPAGPVSAPAVPAS